MSRPTSTRSNPASASSTTGSPTSARRPASSWPSSQLRNPPRDGEGNHACPERRRRRRRRAKHGGGGLLQGSADGEPPPPVLRTATSPSRGGSATAHP